MIDFDTGVLFPALLDETSFTVYMPLFVNVCVVFPVVVVTVFPVSENVHFQLVG